jgi:UDP-N-acetylmuramyl pentapeptide synthase
MKNLLIKELKFFSRYLIRRFRPFIIGVTGSSGKTTTKYFVTKLLSEVSDSVLGSSASFNTEIGLPLAILGINQAPEKWYGWIWIAVLTPIKAVFTFNFEKFLVLEYGADKPGDIDELVEIAQPDIVVITNIGSAHIEKFGSLAKIAEEKWKLALFAKEAVLIQKETAEQIKELGLEKIKVNLFVLPSMKYAKAENIKTLTNRTEFDLYIVNKKFETHFGYFGRHNIDNMELAVYAAHLAVPDDPKLANAVQGLAPLPGRGSRFFYKQDILIIDESYNANPASMKAALSNIKKLNYGRKVIIIGQMAEIGPISKEAHLEIAKLAKEIGDFTVGLGEPFKELGLDRWYSDVSELISEADSLLRPGDQVLVKGSRWANRLDKLIEYFKQK